MRPCLAGIIATGVCALLAGCENSSANPAGHVDVESTSRPAVPEPGVAPTPASPPLVTSRTITRDDDADGVDNYRAVITETFDDAGNLRSRTRAQDFDADGIVDSRVTTTFDEVP